jgi:putative hydrolase of the HAD superfamily
VLLDALGTLVRLEPPAPRLRSALARRGVEVSDAQAAAAMRAEIAYYRAHLADGRDRAGLEDLRRRCAGVMAAELPAPVRALGEEALLGVLLEAIRFTAYPEVPGVLRALREAGARLVVLSNWDVSLHEALAATGLDALVDGAISSAEAGVAKPDPAAFARALALAGTEPASTIHVGDSVSADVMGAVAAGLGAVLVARAGEPDPGPVPDGVRVVRDLAPLAAPYADRRA